MPCGYISWNKGHRDLKSRIFGVGGPVLRNPKIQRTQQLIFKKILFFLIQILIMLILHTLGRL